MISKNDLILMLTNLEDMGVAQSSSYIRKVLKSTSEDLPRVTIETLSFINANKPLDIVQFYEKLRKNYNNKRSDLYINIVREIEEPKEVLTTLAALNLQILLYGNKLDKSEEFFRYARAEELTRVLNEYYKTYNLTNCFKLLKLYKLDLICLENVAGRRGL